MKLLAWLRVLFLGRWSPAFYRDNQAELRGTNFKLLRKATLFSTCMCLFLFCLTLVTPLISELTVFYLCYTLFFAVLSVVVLLLANRHRQLVAPLFYLFATAIFVLVIDVGTRWTPALPAVTFHVFLLIIPILFVTRPLHAVFLSVAACAAFCVTTALVKGADSYLAQTDMLNAICCCIVGIGLDVTIISLHLENIQGKAHFKRQSTTDELTGLSNRRRFDGYAERLFLSRLRPGERIYLFMLDIDDFKRYNDTCGHVQGDDCLQQVARALERTARVHNLFLARFGGEEFVAVAVSHSNGEMRRVAARFVECVAALELPHATSAGGTVTVSVGWAGQADPQDRDPLALLSRADSALYAAKAAGKNRAVAWSPALEQ